MRGTQKAEKNTGKQGSYILFKNVRGEDFYAIFGWLHSIYSIYSHYHLVSSTTMWQVYAASCQ